ncbi:DNA-binding protein [Streptomyces cellostaticus]|uniref:DNA-binding protein n=1 Tax=Streptomyces cellostaticus TaxID=67285 RepID=A0A101NK53_9ACTN|nr:helix-turn-helix transcriptional regulator [Streptomyces cellostaticus]KUM94828.1 DNA-binding protein [Streptomyces cellostaticus]GHI06319.1 transcriptional regulator [Streptomyces cellostaticus]
MAGRDPNRGKTITTVLGRRLGGELLRMRELRSLLQTHAAEALTASTAKVAKMERGQVPLRDPDVRALCHLYGETDETVIEKLLALAKADRDRRKVQGWWHQYPQLKAQMEYVALEDIATELRTWQLAFVPGLLQTPDYTRALAMGNGVWEDPGAIESFVEARMARQARLTGERPLSLWAMLHEGVLRQLVGGRDVMRVQLEHLLDAAQLPNVHLQVVPFSAGAHPGMTSAFTVVSFTEPGALDLVQADTFSTQVWLESETDAAHHNALFDRIARVGLAQNDSLTFIDNFRKEM